MGESEEQTGKVMPGKLKEFLEKFMLVLKAQKGRNAELQDEVR